MIKYSTLGNAVRLAATANNKTIDTIAQYCQVHRTTVNRWLQHTYTMPYYRIYELAAALATDPVHYDQLLLQFLKAHYDYEFHKRKTRGTT